MEYKITTILAIWGAFLSSLHIVWQFRKEFKNRGKLLLVPIVGVCFDEDERVTFGIKTTNIGDKRIRIQEVCLIKTKESIKSGNVGKMKLMPEINSDLVPEWIDPHDTVYIHISLEDAFSKIVATNLESLYIEDSLGRRHYMKNVYVKRCGERIKEHIQRIQGQSRPF